MNIKQQKSPTTIILLLTLSSLIPLLCPLNPPLDNLIHLLYPLFRGLNLKPLLMALPTRLTLLNHPLLPQLEMDHALHPMRMRYLAHRVGARP